VILDTSEADFYDCMERHLGMFRSKGYNAEMKKIMVGLVLLAMQLPTPAYGGGHKASEYVKYKNQKSGQSCAAKDMNKLVKLPNSMILVCKMEGNMHKWKPRGQM
jgi:hypothetical protein